MVPEQRVLDRQAHVRLGDGGDDTAVDELDHRVHDALGMEHDLNPVVRKAIQPVGLHDLVGLVRERRRVDGHLRAHAPRRMAKRFVRGDRGERAQGTIAERTARGGDRDPLDRLPVDPAEALPERAVLAIDRAQPPPRATARGAHEMPADDEHLLVREGDVLASGERGERRPQPGDPRRRDEHEIDVVRGRKGDQIVVPGRDAPHTEPLGEGREHVAPRARRQSGHGQPIGMGGDHVEGLLADRAGRAEDRDAGRSVHLLIIPDPRPASGRPRAERRQ